MATTRQTEIERKYDVEDGGGLPDLSGIEGVGSVETRKAVTLEAVYVDTERGDLARAAITMRRRSGGKDAGWHVKLPAGAGRTEVHAPLDDGTIEGDEVTAPAGLLDAVRLVVRGRPLVPVARIRTRRTALILHDASGREVAEVADDAVSATDLRSGEKRSWHEVEAELLGIDEDGALSEAQDTGAKDDTTKDGGAENDGAVDGGAEDGGAEDTATDTPRTAESGAALLDAIERALLKAGAVPSASRSKLARALGRNDLTDAGEGAVSSSARSSKRPKTAIDAVTASLRTLVDDLLAADPAVRRDDTESVHEMRKVVRRLRSVLAASRRVLDREQADALRARLATLGRVLGEARDAEVRAARATTGVDALPADVGDRRLRNRLIANARRDYRRAHRKLLTFLSGAEYFGLLDALDEFVAAPPASKRATDPAGKAIRRALEKEVDRSLRRAGEARSAGAADALDAQHGARKAARRLRYVAEAAHAGGGIRSRGDLEKVVALAAAAEEVQDVLGDHRDASVFAEHVRAESGRAHAAGEQTFGYGVLFSGARRAADDAETRADEAIRGLRRAAKKL
ncbi:CHAD domain-containing protein [Microbacteriaceae bacterium 4G12]